LGLRPASEVNDWGCSEKPDHLKSRKDRKPEPSAPPMQVCWTIPDHI
jgi:hypothetical protein